MWDELLLFVEHWDFGADYADDVIVDVSVVASGDELAEQLLCLLVVEVRFAVFIAVFVVGVLAPRHVLVILLFSFLVHLLNFLLCIIQLVLLQYRWLVGLAHCIAAVFEGVAEGWRLIVRFYVRFVLGPLRVRVVDTLESNRGALLCLSRSRLL